MNLTGQLSAHWSLPLCYDGEWPQQAFVRDMTPKKVAAETTEGGQRLSRSVEIFGAPCTAIRILPLLPAS
jgi:hypothetical protein